jgi:hypothetical protein
MDVFTTEQGVQLGFVKTSKFWGGGFEPPQTPLSMPLALMALIPRYYGTNHNTMSWLKTSSSVTIQPICKISDISLSISLSLSRTCTRARTHTHEICLSDHPRGLVVRVSDY